MYFSTFFKNSSKVSGGVFKMDVKKGDHSLTLSLASINPIPSCRLFAALASLLNHEIYSLSGSLGPSQINLNLTYVFGLSLLVENPKLS